MWIDHKISDWLGLEYPTCASTNSSAYLPYTGSRPEYAKHVLVSDFVLEKHETPQVPAISKYNIFGFWSLSNKI